MRRIVRPSAIDGDLAVPPSKSVMVRAVAAALLAGPVASRIANPSLCEDALSALRVAEGLGATVSATPEEVGIVGGLAPRQRILDCGESGLGLRTFAFVAALASEPITLTGRPALLRRTAAGLEGPLAALGARVSTRGGFPPVVVEGPLRGGEAVVDGSQSSQFLTGLLLAAPCAAGDCRLVATNLASRPYVRLTLRMLEGFGIRIAREGPDRFLVPGGQRPRVGDFRVEGDWSAAAHLLVFGALGGRLRVTGLDPDSVQADRAILDVLETAGVRVARFADGAEAIRDRLRAFTFDATDAPDLLPPLAALACHCEGTTVLSGAGRLRHKESNRGAVLARELSGLGARVEFRGDALEIRGGALAGGSANAHGDHRVAMALAAAAVAARGPVEIEGAEHVGKSYPRFFRDLAEAGGDVGTHEEPVVPAGRAGE